jgi:hypothetical protein
LKACILHGLIALLLLGFHTQALSQEPSIEISSEALAGCRAPDDLGCSSCCIVGADSCTVKRWSSHENPTTVTPWYNSIESVRECPSNCSPCASCSSRSEKELRDLLTRKPKDCDCAKATIGIDPCFAPMSCACYCSRWEDLKTQCPYE